MRLLGCGGVIETCSTLVQVAGARVRVSFQFVYETHQGRSGNFSHTTRARCGLLHCLSSREKFLRGAPEKVDAAAQFEFSPI